MESLYLLLPMSVLLVLGLIALFAWALGAGQFDDLEREGLRVLDGVSPASNGTASQDADSSPNSDPLDPHQAGS